MSKSLLALSLVAGLALPLGAQEKKAKSGSPPEEAELVEGVLKVRKEYQAKIFEKFYRVPTGNVHNVKGFGLGLYYVQRICLAHGWKIRLQSDAGEGTCMAIQIPRTHPKNTPVYESAPAIR